MTNGSSQSTEEIIRQMKAVLDRQVEIPALEALILALRAPTRSTIIEGAAIALDANAVLRIPQHSKSSDIIDYLSVRHTGPMILPGQVIQEYWNNQLAVVDTVSKSMQKKFDAFQVEVEKAGRAQSDAFEKISEGLIAFKEDNSELFHPETVRQTVIFLETLAKKATVPYAPRLAFQEIAEHRKRVKTPPGFRDSGDGDFFVWVDVLFGLLSSKSVETNASHLILVTNDGKIDWCREGEAHPILCAEAKALVGVEFEIWTLDKFAQAVVN